MLKVCWVTRWIKSRRLLQTYGGPWRYGVPTAAV